MATSDAKEIRRLGIPGLVRVLTEPTVGKRTLFYLVSDAAVVLGASLLTYAVATRYMSLGVTQLIAVMPYAVAGFACQVTIGVVLSIYKLKWSTFSLNDVPRTVLPAFATAVVLGCLSATHVFQTLTPWSALTWGLLNMGGVIAVRGSKRFYLDVVSRKSGKRAVVVVCSEKGYFSLDMLRRIPHFDYRLIGFIDPEPSNKGAVIQGMPVLGTFEEIEQVVAQHRIEAAFVFLSSNPAFAVGDFHQRLHGLGLEVRLVPSLADMINDRADVGALERQTIHELTGRTQVTVDPSEMRRAFGGRRILVTGAGGSIGSELCNQLARFDPASLVLFERDDSNLFYVEKALRDGRPKLDVVPFLGDITREDDVDRAFRQTRPQIVFHAAAYKHVPILEFHPAEAIRVNVQGSHTVASAALRHGVESFVYISTDKAVNPTSVMGTSKRIGETVITSMNGVDGVRFMAVRFGNVLDSRGSVSTIFRDAISLRQPVTITDPDMKRYLMLTSEAVLLVMQAVALGEGGEVFVLDMGNPVRIKDLAETMIRHAGLRPDIDIPIIITGRRPGEKLFEELLTAEEGTAATVNQRIYRACISKNRRYSEVLDDLKRLDAALQSSAPERIRAEMSRQVRNYQPDTGCLNGRPTASGRAAHHAPVPAGRTGPGPQISRAGSNLETAPIGESVKEVKS